MNQKFVVSTKLV